jgi:hypothetical protein
VLKGVGTGLARALGVKPSTAFGFRQERGIMSPFIRVLGGMAAVGRDGGRAPGSETGGPFEVP